MINIFKCPICGQSPNQYPDDMNDMNYECCSAYITGAKNWNRYAVALHFTKLSVDFEDCKPEEEYQYQSMLEWALQDATKEFKEE